MFYSMSNDGQRSLRRRRVFREFRVTRDAKANAGAATNYFDSNPRNIGEIHDRSWHPKFSIGGYFSARYVNFCTRHDCRD